METTTQRPASLAERVLEGKRRELDEFSACVFAKTGSMSKADWDTLAKLQADIAWMTARLAERKQAAG